MTLEQTGLLRFSVGRVGLEGEPPLYAPDGVSWEGDRIDLKGSIGAFGQPGSAYADWTLADAKALRDQLRGLGTSLAPQPFVVPDDPTLGCWVHVDGCDVTLVDLFAGEFDWSMTLYRVAARSQIESLLLHGLRSGSDVASGNGQPLVGVPPSTLSYRRASTSIGDLAGRAISDDAGGGEVLVDVWADDDAVEPAYWACRPGGALDGAARLRVGGPLDPSGWDAQAAADLLAEARMLLRASSVPAGWVPADGWANEGTAGSALDALCDGGSLSHSVPQTWVEPTLVGSGEDAGFAVVGSSAENDNDEYGFYVPDPGSTPDMAGSFTWCADIALGQVGPNQQVRPLRKTFSGVATAGILMEDISVVTSGGVAVVADGGGTTVGDDYGAVSFDPPEGRHRWTMTVDRSADELRFYIDGEQQGSEFDISNVGDASNAVELILAAGSTFHNVALFDRALDPEEVDLLSRALSGDENPGTIDEQLAAMRTIVGDRLPGDVDPDAGWVIDNGLVRAYPAIGVHPSSGERGGITVECWDGTAWESATDWFFASTGGIIDGFASMAVLANDPHEVRLRLTSTNFTGDLFESLFLTIRRGDRMVAGVVTATETTNIVVQAPAVSSTSALTGGERADTDDADGNRAVAATGLGAATGGPLGVVLNATALDFGVGHEIGGSGSSSPDTAQDLADQYAAWVFESIALRGTPA